MSRSCLLVAAIAMTGASCAQTPTTWPFDPKPDPFTPGALLDLRYLNEKTAGETGFIRVGPDGDFLLGNGKPARFWAVGTDVGRDRPWNARPLWNWPEPDLDRHAQFLAKRGVNMVRLHAHINPEPGQNLTDINLGDRDWLWRTVAAMRKQGIYTTFSPYWAVPFRIDGKWGIPGGADQTAFGLVFFDSTLQAAYKSWLRKTLTEPNPYTGVPLAKDPALAIIQIQNEDSLLFWTVNNIKGAQRANLERKYAQWLSRKYETAGSLPSTWKNFAHADDKLADGRIGLMNVWDLTQPLTGGHAARANDQLEFLARTMYDFNQSIGKYLRDDLGCKQVVNAGNWRTADNLRLNDVERWSYTANEVDAVNRYFGGIHRGPNEGWSIQNGDKFTSPSVFDTPNDFPLNLRQTGGRPMLITESVWVMPNGMGAEAPFLISAYQSLNGVDAYYWFAAGTEGFTPPQSANGYNPGQQKWLFGSPDMLGGFPAAALMYRRGDIQRGQPAVTEQRALSDLWQRRTPIIGEDAGFDPNRDMSDASPQSSVRAALNPLAYFVGPVRVQLGGNPAQTQVTDLDRYINRATGVVTSNTGQLAFDTKRKFVRLDAPAAQGVAGFLSGAGKVTLSTIDIESANAFGAVIAVSLDGKPLAESDRVLIQYTGSARPTDWTQSPVEIDMGEGKRVSGYEVKNFGRAPWQVQTARVTLTIRNPKLQTAQPLDANGYAQGKAVKFASRLSLPPDTLYTILTP